MMPQPSDGDTRPTSPETHAAPTVNAAPDANLRSSAVRGGIYLVARQTMGIFLKLLGVMLITRVLGPTEYGAYVAAYSVYMYFYLLGQAGVGVYLLRHDGEPPELAWRTAYTMLLVQALALTAVLIFTRDWLAHITDVAGYSDVMRWMAFGLPFQLLAIPATIRLERALDYRRVAIVEIGADSAYYLLAAPLVLSGFGAVSLGGALLLQQTLVCALAHYLARRWPTFGGDRASAMKVLRYAASFSFVSWVWQLRQLVNPLIVGPVLGAHAVGIVGMTVGILEMLSIIKTIAWRLSVAVLGRVQHDAEKLRQAVTEGMELQILAIGTVVLGFAWFGRFVIPLVFGARWIEVMDYFPYVATAYLSIAAFNVHSAVMSVIDRNRDLGLVWIVHIVLFAGGAWLAVRAFGAIGYGLGEMAALPAYGLLHILLARQIGSPRYTVAAVWWGATVTGLFWWQLGIWAIAVPLAVLALPVSIRRVRAYLAMARRPRAADHVAA